ncbi:MAG: anti-repressor SinI family protein [Bacillota bacterium]|uniref:Anti-repressor SinI family protein n=1 Tax=Virgibacillus salarius TaxID=447199 RepID=A0A941IC48_9BACI|nr:MULTISPECIES: anti-repressor SinI family protein [Bacillaceae]NAZ09736.1 DNA-binding anti-repressor SinI [Agaribacter marinus]MBR7797027.1 anti-repressor SinI family protein [Virgibacillus salarius]MCC2250773.1 anti-repressor SinI family protein [Virgibacillus sp. AGTR]MDY7042853.1 anti-repressor SinI family protein [Virgibacillus sp. M23]QRZ18055.1 anti-repressor SinI family protein [Virgibacillus sp. AGTR]
MIKQISLDSEWVDLIRQAKTLGIPLEEIRDFLHQSENKNKV